MARASNTRTSHPQLKLHCESLHWCQTLLLHTQKLSISFSFWSLYCINPSLLNLWPPTLYPVPWADSAGEGTLLPPHLLSAAARHGAEWQQQALQSSVHISMTTRHAANLCPAAGPLLSTQSPLTPLGSRAKRCRWVKATLVITLSSAQSARGSGGRGQESKSRRLPLCFSPLSWCRLPDFPLVNFTPSVNTRRGWQTQVFDTSRTAAEDLWDSRPCLTECV